jgi:hypothetical protein
MQFYRSIDGTRTLNADPDQRIPFQGLQAVARPGCLVVKTGSSSNFFLAMGQLCTRLVEEGVEPQRQLQSLWQTEPVYIAVVK